MSNFDDLSTVQILLNSYGSLSPLSNNETLSYIERLEKDNNDMVAKNNLYIHNIKFIYNKIKNYNIGNTEDLFNSASEGFSIGLNNLSLNKIKSISETKNMDANHALFYFVCDYIKCSVNKYLQAMESKSVTEYEFKHIRKVRAAMDKVNSLFGSSISYEEKLTEVASRTNLTTKQVRQALDASDTPLSIYSPISNKEGDEEAVLGDTLQDPYSNEPFEEIWKSDMISNLNESCFLILSKTEREVLFYTSGYNGPEMSVTEVAKLFGKSRQWVYNTLSSAYTKLQHSKYDLEAYYIA